MSDDLKGSLGGALGVVFSEIVNGPASTGAFLLNRGDQGLLQSLERLSPTEASAVPGGGGASIAAHVDHLCYGLELLIRWSRGDEPFHDANFAASWQRLSVSDSEWVKLRERLRAAVGQWQQALREPSMWSQLALSEMIASVAHIAYHLGAIRQINRLLRGPSARD